MKLRPEVEWFANRMEERLANFDDIRGDSWLNEGFDFFLERMAETRDALVVAISHNEAKVAIKETVDLANFAMMLADQMSGHRRRE